MKQKEGYASTSNNRTIVVLETELTEDLILEGLARECVSKVQQLRKNNDFNIVDRIKLYYSGDLDFDLCISKFESYIKDETLSLELIKDDNIDESFDLNGHSVKLKVEKVG